MNKTKLPRLLMVVVVTLVIIAIPVIYYVFGCGLRGGMIKTEHYEWEQDAEIMKNCERFKSIEPGTSSAPSTVSRNPEGRVLFPIIKIGMSTREVRALFGEPSLIIVPKNKNIEWYYTLFWSEQIILEISNDKVVRKDFL